MSTTASTPKLTFEQEASKENYMEWAEGHFNKRHAENPEKYPDLLPKYLDHLQNQDFTKVFDEQGFIKGSGGNFRSPAVDEFLVKEANIFEGTLKHIAEKGTPPPVAIVIEEAAVHSPATEETLRSWASRAEKSAAAIKGKQFLSMASVGVGSVIMVDGVLNLVAPPTHNKIQQDGNITKERVSPVGKELAKIAIGAGTMGAGLLLTIERKGAPGPHAL